MFKEKAKSTDVMSGSVQKGKGVAEGLKGGGVFTVICFDKDGNLKWEAKSHNLVVNVGLQDMNTKYFKGSGYTAAWYIGLLKSRAGHVMAVPLPSAVPPRIMSLGASLRFLAKPARM